MALNGIPEQSIENVTLLPAELLSFLDNAQESLESLTIFLLRASKLSIECSLSFIACNIYVITLCQKIDGQIHISAKKIEFNMKERS